jgi:TonB family protein
MRGPQLLATRDPCAGYFPGTAAANRGDVQLAIDVDAQGHARAREIMLESPRGQGFEKAAKACASQLRFAPALDTQGHPVSGRARIALRFHRS